MAKYIFAIDETGSFMINNDHWSFVCGIHVDADESALSQAYRKTYEDLGFPAPTPTDTRDLLNLRDEEISSADQDKARFHFNKLNSEQASICRANLLPLVKTIFVSKGTPIVYANNQNWWIIALVVVIRKFLSTTDFRPDSDIEVWIDNRSDKVWGLANDSGIGGENDHNRFRTYHDLIKAQLKRYLNKYVPNDCRLKIFFNSDTSSFSINLADIVCGLVRRDRGAVTAPIVECHCQAFTDGSNPIDHLERNPMQAYNLIMQEVIDGSMRNIGHLSNILKRLRDDAENYTMTWSIFQDVMEYKIGQRSHKSEIADLRQLADIFTQEFSRQDVLDSDRRLEIMVLLMKYYSHIGEIEPPFDRATFMTELSKTGSRSESRILQKWEKLLDYSYREAQFMFNNYRFAEVAESFKKLCDTHDAIFNTIYANIFPDSERKTDEPSTAIYGTMAQAYAYNDEPDNAIEYCELSKEFAVKTTSQTDSYLFNIYHRMGNLDKCHASFENQAGKSAQDYGRAADFSNQWQLLSYCKLIALELYRKGNTDLVIPTEYVCSSHHDEYPFPLILKWTAISLYLQDRETNRATYEAMFCRACDQLLDDNNGFVIRTLALPIMQCYSFVNKHNTYHSQYNRYLTDLKNTSVCFSDYVDSKAAMLNDIKNDCDIWQRALLLPFIYS